MTLNKRASNQPLLDAHSTKEMNLNVLRRRDSSIEEILITATHVTLYELDTNNNSWQRKDVEGSMFVVKRKEQPRFQFLVMNRRSTDNLIENLLGDFIFETQVPYIFYRNEKEVNGIWFYDTNECDNVSKLFSRILNAFSKSTHEKAKIPSSIDDYKELEGNVNEDSLHTPLEASIINNQINEINEVNEMNHMTQINKINEMNKKSIPPFLSESNDKDLHKVKASHSYPNVQYEYENNQYQRSNDEYDYENNQYEEEKEKENDQYEYENENHQYEYEFEIEKDSYGYEYEKEKEKEVLASFPLQDSPFFDQSTCSLSKKSQSERKTKSNQVNESQWYPNENGKYVSDIESDLYAKLKLNHYKTNYKNGLQNQNFTNGTLPILTPAHESRSKNKNEKKKEKEYENEKEYEKEYENEKENENKYSEDNFYDKKISFKEKEDINAIFQTLNAKIGNEEDRTVSKKENFFFLNEQEKNILLPPQKNVFFEKNKNFVALEEIESQNFSKISDLQKISTAKPSSPLDIFLKPLLPAPPPPPPHPTLLPPSSFSSSSSFPNPNPSSSSSSPFSFLLSSSFPTSSASNTISSPNSSSFLPPSIPLPSSSPSPSLSYTLSSPLLSFSAPPLNPNQHASFPSLLSHPSSSLLSSSPSLLPFSQSIPLSFFLPPLSSTSSPSPTSLSAPFFPLLPPSSSSPPHSPSSSPPLPLLPQPSHGSALLQPFPPSSIPSFPLQSHNSTSSKLSSFPLPSPSLPPSYFSSSSSSSSLSPSSTSLITPLSLLSNLLPQSNLAPSSLTSNSPSPALPSPPFLSPSRQALVKREEVRRALLKLLMDDRFVDAFCEELNSSKSPA